MYKKLLELCESNNIDIEKAYVALLCSETVGIDDPAFEDICKMTYNQMFDELEDNIEIV